MQALAQPPSYAGSDENWTLAVLKAVHRFYACHISRKVLMDISFVFVFSVVHSHPDSLACAWMVPRLCLAVSPTSTRAPLGLWKALARLL